MYCRIDLSKIKYKELDNCRLLSIDNYADIVKVYEKYCRHKKFKGVRPIFSEDLTNPNTHVLGYYDNEELVAFSIIMVYPSQNSVIADQFAWDYENLKLKLGYKSLRSECARYKRLGYDYFYLGDFYGYKAELTGFELGPALM